MRYWSHIAAATIACCLLVAQTTAEQPIEDKAILLDGPLAELAALGLPLRGGTLDEDMHIRMSSDLSKLSSNELQYLSISSKQKDHTPTLTNEVFDILPKFPKLKWLRIEYRWIDAQNLPKLKQIPQLTRLDIHMTTRGSQNSFSEPSDLDFLSELPELEWLGLTGCGLTNEMMPKLLPLKSLRRLRLSWNYELTDAVLPIMEQLPALETLSMSYTKCYPPRMVERHFAAKLKSFNYTPSYVPSKASDRFTVDELREISELPRHIWAKHHKTLVPLAQIVELLPGPIVGVEYKGREQEITLSGVDSKGESFVFGIRRSLSDQDLATIGQMKELEWLYVKLYSGYTKENRLTFSDAGLSKLVDLPKLERLTLLLDQYKVTALEQEFYLTNNSLPGLSTMPALRSVVLSPVNFDLDSMDWAPHAPKLTKLEIHKGVIEGDAFADLAKAPSLKYLTLGYDHVSAGSDSEVYISRPTESFSLSNIQRLRWTVPQLETDGMEVVSRMRSLESVVLKCPVTDMHMKQLGKLRELTGFQVTKEAQPGLNITNRGLMQLRRNRKHLSVRTPLTTSSLVERAMADQFDWFIDWGCGCCGSEGMSGHDWWPEDIKDGRLMAIDANFKVQAARIRGPLRQKEFTIARQDLPSTIDTLCLTDCRCETLRLEGWLPRSIRIWCDSRIPQIIASNTPEQGHAELCYYYLENEERLVVPKLPRLSRLVVASCIQLKSIELHGDQPNLKSIDFETLPNVELVDLRNTAITDACLEKLAKLPALKQLKINGCKNLSNEAIAKFREARALVQLDGQSD